MSIWTKLFGKKSKTATSIKPKDLYTTQDNVGTIIHDYGHYQGLLLSVMKTQAENPGVAAFSFPDQGIAQQALNELSYIKTAQDTGNPISLLTIDYGVFLSDGWVAVVHGKGLTKEAHEEAVRVFLKHGGKELANRVPQKASASDVSAAAEGTVSFSHRQDLSKSGGIGSKMIYKATMKPAAVEFLKNQKINEMYFYIEIETPEGSVGKDIDGIYEF